MKINTYASCPTYLYASKQHSLVLPCLSYAHLGIIDATVEIGGAFGCLYGHLVFVRAALAK